MFISGHRVIIAAAASEPEANEQGSRSFFIYGSESGSENLDVTFTALHDGTSRFLQCFPALSLN